MGLSLSGMECLLISTNSTILMPSPKRILKPIEAKIQKEKDKLVHDWAEEGIRVEKLVGGGRLLKKAKSRAQ